MNWEGRRVLVLGLGRSGEAVAEKLVALGAEVTACDHEDSEPVKAKSQLLEKRGVAVRLGRDCPGSVNGYGLVVISPGVPDELPLVQDAHKQGVPVWSEIELAFRLTTLPIIGITGTNGKTTTTVLVGEVFKRAGVPAVVAGNIGLPLVKSLEQTTPHSWLITELSSFQLQNTWKFKPHIGLLLNITEDHLDRHADFEDYVRAKSRLFLNQTKGDFAVVNINDRFSKVAAEDIKSQLLPFGSTWESRPGVYLKNGEIVSTWKDKGTILKVSDLKIRGSHNIDNCLGTVATCLAAGIAPEAIAETLSSFEGLEHRCEFVAECQGVEFYNDSKATNPDATIKALTAFDKPIVLLAGGRNKDNSFEGLARDMGKRAKAVVLFGESAGEIKGFLYDQDILVKEANTLEEAVERAYGLSEPGDIVLLSPACASFDMFSNYEERGKAFKEAVRKLKEM